jgi:tetratricopeptide (TPR) repeat protein
VKRALTLVVLFGALAASGLARAEDPPTFVRLNEEGAAFYHARDFRKAIARFEQAYALEPDPNLLFNIARCRQALGENAAAIEGYERFLQAERAEPEGRAKAEHELAALRASEQERGRTSYLVPALTFLGAGALVATVGAVVYVGGVHDHKEVTGAANYDNPEKVYGLSRAQAQSLVDSGDRKKIAGGIAMAVGGALLATGAGFVVFGRRPVSVGLEPAHGGALASVAGRF